MFYRMIPMTRFLPPLSLLAAFGTLRAQSAQGVSYAMSFVSDSAGHKTTMRLGEGILGSKLRLSTTVDNSPVGPLAMYMIIDSVAGTMTSVMPSRSIATVTGSAMLKDPAMQPYTAEVSGVPRIDAGTQWISAQHGYAQQLAAFRKSATKGVVLRQTGMTTTALFAADTTAVHFTWEVTQVKQGPVDPADFEIPTGYTVIDPSLSMAAFDSALLRDAMASAMAKTRERLEQTLCAGAEIRRP
jgi:hypothetical protein